MDFEILKNHNWKYNITFSGFHRFPSNGRKIRYIIRSLRKKFKCKIFYFCMISKPKIHLLLFSSKDIELTENNLPYIGAEIKIRKIINVSNVIDYLANKYTDKSVCLLTLNKEK